MSVELENLKSELEVLKNLVDVKDKTIAALQAELDIYHRYRERKKTEERRVY
jgi:hypothetical protein